MPDFMVLIESDWNLKEIFNPSTFTLSGINRIRLEFKGNGCVVSFFVHIVLIESDWNLKKEGYISAMGYSTY